MHILSVDMCVFVNHASNLLSRPGNILSALFSPRGDLALPEFALVVPMECERGCDFLQRLRALGFSHEHCGWDQNEMPRWVDYHVNVDAFKNPVPSLDRTKILWPLRRIPSRWRSE